MDYNYQDDVYDELFEGSILIHEQAEVEAYWEAKEQYEMRANSTDE